MPLAVQVYAQVVKRQRIVGPQPQGLSSSGDGAVELTLIGKNVAESNAGFGKVALEPEGFLASGKRFIVLFLIAQGVGQIVMELRVGRVAGGGAQINSMDASNRPIWRAMMPTRCNAAECCG